MGKLNSNNYRLWIESSTPGTYNQIAGQTDLSYTRSSGQIDTSDKNNSPYATSTAGLFDVGVTLSGKADLPDATGLTLADTKFKAQTSWKFQIRKGGSSGADPADVVFAATCNILELSYDMSQNSAVGYALKLSLASAPTTDVLA